VVLQESGWGVVTTNPWGGGVKMGEGRTKEEKSVIYRCQVLANNNVLSKPWVNK